MELSIEIYCIDLYMHVILHTHNFRKCQVSPCQGDAVTLNSPFSIMKSVLHKIPIMISLVTPSHPDTLLYYFRGDTKKHCLSNKIGCYQTFMACGEKMQLLAVLILSLASYTGL